MRQHLARLERANQVLLAKLKASFPMSITWQTHVPSSLHTQTQHTTSSPDAGLPMRRSSSSNSSRKNTAKDPRKKAAEKHAVKDRLGAKSSSAHRLALRG